MAHNTLSRRNVVAGIAATTALAGLPNAALARKPKLQLEATTREVEVNGKLVKRLAVVGPDGPEGLRLKRGDDFAVRLTNRLDSETLIHWHGLILPPSQDGVPGISAPAIPPGGFAEYDFPLVQAGTYWMHSHVGFQEQLGLAMPLILEDPDDPLADLQEVVLFLEDFTFTDLYEILKDLQMSGKPNMPSAQGAAMFSHGAAMSSHQHTMPAGGAAKADGMKMDGMKMDGAKTEGVKMGAMEAMPIHPNDVDFDAYLANSRTLRDPQVVKVERNGRVRVRIINGSASTNFFVSVGGRPARLIAVDGEPVEPVDDTVFPIAIAQRMDLLVDVPGGEAVPVLAQREGETQRTGLILVPPGAAVAKLSEDADVAVGVMGSELEARLRTAAPLPARPIEAELLSTLSGDMERYVWMMHGDVYPRNRPLVAITGQRTAIRIRNETDMAHPMHLHGHVFQVVEIAGKPLAGAVRDTVMVPARSDLAVAFDANNPGNWAYHCHNLYHMEAGMFSYLTYVPAT